MITFILRAFAACSKTKPASNGTGTRTGTRTNANLTARNQRRSGNASKGRRARQQQNRATRRPR